MSTQLFLRNTLAAYGFSVGFHLLASTRGSGVTTSVTDTVGSGTQIQCTDISGGSGIVLSWLSGRVPSGGFTLSGTMTFNVWALESAAQANATIQARVFKYGADGTVTEVGGGPWSFVTEVGTSAAAKNWTGTPTSTAFAENDRLLVRFYVTNAGTMGGGRTVTVDYSGTSGAADGDSFFQITETVALKAEAMPPTGSLSTMGCGG
jgi:hypothetical protein